jgi:hypothetical protein
VWSEGVDHGDEPEPNILWNEDRRRVMLIDFDRAALRPASNISNCRCCPVMVRRENGKEIPLRCMAKNVQ